MLKSTSVFDGKFEDKDNEEIRNNQKFELSSSAKSFDRICISNLHVISRAIFS